MRESREGASPIGRRRAIVLVAWIVVAACGGGGGGAGGGDSEEAGPPLGESEARAAIVTELLAQPEKQVGIVRFAVHDSGTEIEGVADYDHQRYLSRLEVKRPDMVASYDRRGERGQVRESPGGEERRGQPAL